MIVKGMEKKENNNVSFQVEIEKGEFEAAINKAYLKNKKSIAVPGFRKGKAPRMVIEGMYGKEVFYDDAINDLSPEAFDFGVTENDINAVGRPSVADMEVSDDKTLTLTFETAVYPEVTLGEYKGLEAPKAEVSVPDSDIDDEIERIRDRNSRLVAVERPAQNGDTAVIDFEGFLEGVPFDGGKGEAHSLELGSGQFVPGFEEQVVGMAPGEEKDIDITFPESYHEELAGKAVVFKVKVNEIKEKELPELDDEFAKDVSEFDTLDEYKNSIRENLENAKKNAAEESYKDILIKTAIENMTVEIPEAMIDEQQEKIFRDYSQSLASQGISLEQYTQMMGIDPQTFYDTARPAAQRQVETTLLLTKIAEVEDFQFTAEEIDEEYKKLAEQYNMEIEKVKELVDEEGMKSDLGFRKASELIFETGVPVELVEEEAETEENTEAEEKAE